MTQGPRSVAVRTVEVRTWPERCDLLVIDPDDGLLLARFPYIDPADGKVADLRCGYDERVRRALRQLQADQALLRFHYDVDDDHEVHLRVGTDDRQRMQELLSPYDLTLADLELPVLRQTILRLRDLGAERLHALLTDWYDVVERYQPAGTSAADPDSWVHRAAPDRRVHFHYISAGIEDRAAATQDMTDDAYAMFWDIVDTDLTGYTFGHALRWLYFHLTEFPEYRPFPPSALAQHASEQL